MLERTRPEPENAREIERMNQGLLPRLGLFTTTMIVIGAMIGSGIFRKPGTMAGDVGSPEILLAVWILAGIITFFGALTNAEVAGMIPETGGQYIYFDKMYGSFFAYIYGWAVFAVIQTGSIASIAYVFAEYATKFIIVPSVPGWFETYSFSVPFVGQIRPFGDFWVKMIAAGLILLLTAVNYIGVRFGGLVQNVFTVSKIVAMVVLVAMAFLAPGIGSATNLTADSGTIMPQGLGMVVAIAVALQGAFWAYDGWNNVTYIAGEVIHPQRTIPRALVLGMSVTIVVYVLINLAYCYVLPIDRMAASKLVAADVADTFFTNGGRWIAALVMLSTFGTVNGTILASARVYFSMARKNVFPRFLGAAHPRFNTPAASLAVQGLWSILLLFSGTFDTLTDMLIFVSWVFYAAGAYGIFVLRKRYPDAPRPYKVPGYPYVPAIFVVFAVVYLGLTLYYDVDTYLTMSAAGKPAMSNTALGMVLVAVGIPIYLYYRRRRTTTGGDQRA